MESFHTVNRQLHPRGKLPVVRFTRVMPWVFCEFIEAAYRTKIKDVTLIAVSSYRLHFVDNSAAYEVFV